MIEAAWFLLGAALASTGMYLLCSSHYDRLLEAKEMRIAALQGLLTEEREQRFSMNVRPAIDIPLGPRSA